MNNLKYDGSGFGPIYFIGEKLNERDDFLIRSNCDRDNLDLLVFLDSRGVGGAYKGSIAERVIMHIQEGRRFLMICRPLELTTWATFFNFMTLNKLNPGRIVTNMGFVDFTPKKESILLDAIQQVEALMGNGVAESKFAEHYVSSSGESLPLFSMSYGSAYKRNVEEVIKNRSAVIMNSPLLAPDIRIKRERPKSFFSNLEISNNFNRSIDGAKVIDFQGFDEKQTCDGVHYTIDGNEQVFKALGKYL